MCEYAFKNACLLLYKRRTCVWFFFRYGLCNISFSLVVDRVVFKREELLPFSATQWQINILSFQVADSCTFIWNMNCIAWFLIIELRDVCLNCCMMSEGHNYIIAFINFQFSGEEMQLTRALIKLISLTFFYVYDVSHGVAASLL